MKSLKNLLEKRKKSINISLNDKDIFYIFQRVIREEYGNIGVEKFKADFYKNRILFIKSDSSAWASELWMNKDKLIKKMNAELGDGAVERIKIK